MSTMQSITISSAHTTRNYKQEMLSIPVKSIFYTGKETEQSLNPIYGYFPSILQIIKLSRYSIDWMSAPMDWIVM